METSSNLKAIVFTALPKEFAAVLNHLTNCEKVVHDLGDTYMKGDFQCDNRTWEVLVVQVTKGNVNASSRTERAVQYFGPSIALMVGVAGGIWAEIESVVVASKISDYHSGMSAEDFKSRPEVAYPSHRILEHARAEAREKGWLKFLPFIPPGGVAVVVEPIACGEQVITSKKSDSFEIISTRYNDAVAVEMEGFGFLRAMAAHSNIQALVVRGISDLIEGKEVSDRGGSQERASTYAAAFAFNLLATIPLQSGAAAAGHLHSGDEVDGSQKGVEVGTLEDGEGKALPKGNPSAIWSKVIAQLSAGIESVWLRCSSRMVSAYPRGVKGLMLPCVLVPWCAFVLFSFGSWPGSLETQILNSTVSSPRVELFQITRDTKINGLKVSSDHIVPYHYFATLIRQIRIWHPRAIVIDFRLEQQSEAEVAELRKVILETHSTRIVLVLGLATKSIVSGQLVSKVDDYRLLDGLEDGNKGHLLLSHSEFSTEGDGDGYVVGVPLIVPTESPIYRVVPEAALAAVMADSEIFPLTAHTGDPTVITDGFSTWNQPLNGIYKWDMRPMASNDIHRLAGRDEEFSSTKLSRSTLIDMFRNNIIIIGDASGQDQHYVFWGPQHLSNDGATSLEKPTPTTGAEIVGSLAINLLERPGAGRIFRQAPWTWMLPLEIPIGCIWLCCVFPSKWRWWGLSLIIDVVILGLFLFLSMILYPQQCRLNFAPIIACVTLSSATSSWISRGRFSGADGLLCK